MERSTVNVATAALGPVLEKLAALLGDESMLDLEQSPIAMELPEKLTTLLRDRPKLDREGCRRDIAFIRSELEPVYSLLLKLYEVNDVDMACKQWMIETWKLSYDMDDGINHFVLGLERANEGFKKARPFRDLRIRVKDLLKQCRDEWKTLQLAVPIRSKPNVDPRARFLHKDASELMGMEERKHEVIERLQNHEMVCIVGFAGMGKTTLANQVYHAVGGEFQCRAFVSFSRSPDMLDVLSVILSQVTDRVELVGSGTKVVAEENLINDMSDFLSDKRYLVIVDDIWHWEEWEITRKAFPKNKLGSKIIMTTRVSAVAERCHSEQGAYIYKQSFFDSEGIALSEAILNKYVTSSILETTTKSLHEIGRISLSSELAYMCGGMPLALICLSSVMAESLVQGTYRGWDTWVRHIHDQFLRIPSMKALVESLCLSYDDLPIHLRTCLLYCTKYPKCHDIERHGLVRKWIAEGFVYEEEAAEAYFEELVSRHLLLPSWRRSLYKVHPMMLHLLVCKSKETDVLSHTRSLVLCYTSWHSYVPREHRRTLVMLDLVYCSDLENNHVVHICELLFLKYLGLKGCSNITVLPQEIGRLQNLETLDVRSTCVRELPCETAQLPHLVCVLAGAEDCPQVVKFPDNWGQAWKNDTIITKRLAILLIDHFFSSAKPLPIKVRGRHMHVPQWISLLGDVSSLDIRLCNLGEDDQKALGELPCLQYLVVRFELLPKKTIAISGRGFTRLIKFCVDCRVPRVSFQPGSMPNLKYLEFMFYTGPASKDPVGIMHLRSLEKVIFSCTKHYRSDSAGISATIEVVSKEAKENPNRITLRVNDKEEVLSKEKVADIYDENSINGIDRNGAGIVETSPAVNHSIDFMGKAFDVSNHASCSPTSEIDEVDENSVNCIDSNGAGVVETSPAVNHSIDFMGKAFDVSNHASCSPTSEINEVDENSVNCIDSNGAGVVETSPAVNHSIDFMGKAFDVSNHASCSHTSEIDEVEEAQEYLPNLSLTL